MRTCAVYFLSLNACSEDTPLLLSPARQMFFLLGLMLPTPEPATPVEFVEKEWHRSIELLNAIDNAYAAMFWPTPEEQPNVTDEWYAVRMVAMPAFLHCLGTTLCASVEQIADRIRRYIVPFDDEFESALGLSASKALEVAEWIAEYLQSNADQLQEVARRALLTQAQDESYRVHFDDMMMGLRGFLTVSRTAIEDRFGKITGDSFWKGFVSRRGDVSSLTYPTERNVAAEKPLFEIEEGVVLCPSTSALCLAILEIGELQLSSGETRQSFLKKRDVALEMEVQEKLLPLFGDSAGFYAGVFETQTLQHEHDLVICRDKRLFVFEAKASPPDEPFRDPDKAFIRLKRAFKSDGGIQEAYRQADRIRRRLASGD